MPKENPTAPPSKPADVPAGKGKEQVTPNWEQVLYAPERVE